MPNGINGLLNIANPRLLSNVYKSLNIVRQILPLYREVKPALKKIPEILYRINSFKNSNINYSYLDNDNKELEKSENLIEKKSINNPAFFQ